MKDLCKKMFAINLSLIMIFILMQGILPVYAEGGTLTYIGNGGTAYDGTSEYEQKVESFNSVKLQNNYLFSRSGYIFLHWKGTNGVIYTESRTYKIPSTIRLVAQWGYARTIYNGNGGTSQSGDSVEEQYIYSRDDGAKYYDGNIFSYPGYVFTGWNTLPDGSGLWYMPDENIKTSMVLELYAQWEPEPSNGRYIKYSANRSSIFGGKAYSYTPVTSYPAKITLPSMSDTIGTSYIGWANKAGVLYGENDTITVSGNTDFTAHYTAAKKGIIYHGNGGYTQNGSTVRYDTDNSCLLNTNAFFRSGKYLTSWNTAPDGSGTQYSVSQSIPDTSQSEALHLYAQWKNRATSFVTYIGNGGTTNNGTPYFHRSVNSFDNVTTEGTSIFSNPGYILLGWEDENHNIYNENTVCKLPENAVLTAIWGYARIKYHENNPSGTDASLPLVGYVFPQAGSNRTEKSTFAVDGYAFTGWNTRPDGSGQWYPEYCAVKEPIGTIDLYAQWTELPVKYICFDANGSDVLGGKSRSYVKADAFPAKITLPSMTSNENYSYIGWTSSQTPNYGNRDKLTTYSPDSSVSFAETTTVYAWYTSTPAGIQVVYNGNGGTGSNGSTTSFDAVSGGNLKLYSDMFSNENSELTGWNTKPDGTGTQYGKTDILKQELFENQTTYLFAQWRKPDEYIKGAILNCSEKENTVSAEIKITYAAKNGYAIMAVFDDNTNTLAGIQKTPVTTNSDTITIPCTCSVLPEKYSVKIFFWNSLNGIIPLGTPIISQ